MASSRRWSRLILLLVLLAASALLAALLVEGAHVFVTGRPLLSAPLRLVPVTRIDMLDEERLKLAAKTEGPFALALDPEVAFHLKGNLSREFLGAKATTDARGQRVRTGPPPEPGALRIVVLGDSFAFGFGVADDQTFAAALERCLAATVATGAPPPVVTTMASPGWNAHNAFSYLQAHVARVDPQVVLFIPVGNDLHDSFATTEVGHRSLLFDPALGSSRPHVSVEAFSALLPQIEPNIPAADKLTIWRMGGLAAVPHALVTGILPESVRRWRGLVAGTRAIHDLLATRKTRFAVGTLWDGDYERMLEHELMLADARIEVWPALHGLLPGDTLPADGHPNAATIQAAARIWAARMVDLGWVPGAGARPLPELDPAFAGRRTQRRTREEGTAWLAERHATWRQFMAAEVDLETGKGFTQIYGGVHPDGAAGPRVWLGLLSTPAQQLLLRLRRLPARSGVYPLQLKVELEPGVTALVPVPMPASDQELDWETRVPLTTTGPAPAGHDLLLSADRWVEEVHQGQSRLVSFRFRLARLVP